MKIYYVEDERDLSDIIRKYLTKEGFNVSVFMTVKVPLNMQLIKLTYGY